MKRIAGLPPLAFIVAALITGCGVSFSEDFDGTELFKGIELTGGRVAGSELTVRLHITNGYPVPLLIACYYEDPNAVTEDQEKLTFQERATLIGDTVLPAHPDRRPDFGGDKAAEQASRETLAFTFVAPAAGDYFLVCLTPAASDNGLSLNFKIR